MLEQRRTTLLSGIPSAGPGDDAGDGLMLELGPLHEPVTTKPEHNVKYVDRISHSELVAHYAPQGVPVERIVPLDYVWDTESNLVNCVDGETFSYCIASHVIEHVPDLIGWLNQIASVMEPGGVLSLAIPNRDHTFDRLRPLTTVAELVDASIAASVRPTPKQVYCHFRNNVNPEGEHTESLEFSLHAARQAAAGVYVDVHCWVFVEDSFREAIQELSELQLTQFRYLDSSSTEGEFFAQLELSG